MYFIPAFFARVTHASASNLAGSNCFASALYWATGILALRMIHSPIIGTGLPSQNPAGTA